MICPNCNQQVREGAEYCGKCGYPVKPPPIQKKRTLLLKIAAVISITVLLSGIILCGLALKRRIQTPLPGQLTGEEATTDEQGISLIDKGGSDSTEGAESEDMSPDTTTVGGTAAQTQEAAGQTEDTAAQTQEAAGQTVDTATQDQDTAAQTNPGDKEEQTGDTQEIDSDKIGSMTKIYPSDADDFVTYHDLNGVYSYVFPHNFFKTGVYNPKEKKYELKTADGCNVLTISEKDSITKNDPLQSAEDAMNAAKEFIDLDSGDVYTYQTSEISDSGYARAIVSGPDKFKEGVEHYMVCACTNEKVYILIYSYREDQKYDKAEDSPNGYLSECFYRGWSISGSSKSIRSFQDYKNGVDPYNNQ